MVKHFLASLALLIAVLPGLQAEGQGSAIIQKIMEIVLTHNPVIT